MGNCFVLTGSPGCGKSHFLNIANEANIPTFSADKLIANLYQYNEAGWRTLREHFGVKIAPDNKAVDKNMLIELFQDRETRYTIENLIVSLVFKDLGKFWHKNRHTSTIAELPTYFESKRMHPFEPNVFVYGIYCPFEFRYPRLRDRGWSSETIDMIESWHLPEQVKMSFCDSVIFNVSTKDDFKRKIKNVIELIVRN